MTGPMRVAIAAFFVGFSYVSCSSVEHDATCAGVCERYNACFDDELDVDDCTSDCADDAGDNEAFVGDVDRCETCMDAMGCGESAFDCFDECGGVFGQAV